MLQIAQKLRIPIIQTFGDLMTADLLPANNVNRGRQKMPINVLFSVKIRLFLHLITLYLVCYIPSLHTAFASFLHIATLHIAFNLFVLFFMAVFMAILHHQTTCAHRDHSSSIIATTS